MFSSIVGNPISEVVISVDSGIGVMQLREMSIERRGNLSGNSM